MRYRGSGNPAPVPIGDPGAADRTDTDNLHGAIEEFLIESVDSLACIDRDLAAFERTPHDPAILDRVFRALHTIKGTAGQLGFSRLESVSHEAETLAGGIRDASTRTGAEPPSDPTRSAERIRRSLTTELHRLIQRHADRAILEPVSRFAAARAGLHRSRGSVGVRPIGAVWASLSRLARRLATESGKEVRVEMEGKTTEVPIGVLQAIKDPLLHLVRNAIAHGIEEPAVRQAAGKPSEGVLRFCASALPIGLIVQVSDDGGGIDPETIRQVAVRRGLVSADQALAMSDAEALHAIFRAGFSLAGTIDTLSGRGVGLDVVRVNVEAIGGTVSVESRIGRGTTVTLNIADC